MDGKTIDAVKKVGFVGVGLATGAALGKTPMKKLGQQAVDTYLGRGASAIKDGYFDNRVKKIVEASWT